ncbi:hypothetical protein BYT27DRAFT_7104415, partial [Phlegmacium glaucopus]
DDNYQTHGRVDPPAALLGRSRISNAQAINDLPELIPGTPSVFLEEFGEWLALYHDMPILTYTIT